MKTYNNRAIDSSTIGKYRQNLDQFFTEDEDNLPIIPRLPDSFPSDPTKAIAKCGECGRKIYRIEGYSCSNGRCPVQPKVTC